MRLVMSVQMIQGHAISALLDPRDAAGPIYDAWVFLRGLTAVGFLVAAGASYALAVERPGDRKDPPRDPLRRVRRAGLLIAIGFALRPPAAALDPDPLARAAAWDAFFAVDVLQCIGVTLLLLEGASLLTPRARAPLVAGVIGALCLLLAPLAAPLEAEPPARWLLDWITRSGGSLFPLLPWSGFVWLGLALAPLVRAATSTRGALGLVGVGAIVAAIGRGLAWVVTPAAPEHYYAWPPFSLLRLGLVLVIFGALSLFGGRLVLPAWARALARQTLVLYVVHLVILHAAAVGLANVLGARLHPAQAIGVASGLVVVSAAAALGWDRLRGGRP